MGKEHPKKEIADALDHAIKHGWILELSKGHAFGILRCPTNNKCRGGHYCQLSVFSTPKSPSNHARRIKDAVDKCTSKIKVKK